MYLLLLTALHRVVVRIVTPDGRIEKSALYPGPTAALLPAAAEREPDAVVGKKARVDEPAVICAAAGTNAIAVQTGAVAESLSVFVPFREGLIASRRAHARPHGFGFSKAAGMALEGPTETDPDAVFAAAGALFRHGLVDGDVTRLASLPAGDVLAVTDSARDASGALIAVILTMVVEGEDDLIAAAPGGSEGRYLLCTRRKEGEAWNVSEPQEGRDACFMGAVGASSKIAVVSASGKAVSVVAFGTGSTHSRGVQRYRLNDAVVRRAFWTPMGDGLALLYWDQAAKKMGLTRNARYHADGRTDYELNSENVLEIEDNESVLDVQWSAIPTAGKASQYLGFVLTNLRLIMFKNLLQVSGTVRLETLYGVDVPFCLPQATWLGPCVGLFLGSALHTVTLDGLTDLLSTFSDTDGNGTLLRVLPDRAIYLRPPPRGAPFMLSVRPLGTAQVLLRGILALPASGDASAYQNKILSVLTKRDASQLSHKALFELSGSGLTGVAHGLVSSSGSADMLRSSLTPDLLALLYIELHDFRRALLVLEEEYSTLSDIERDFHSGTALFRAFQSLGNHAMIGQDYQVAQRCAKILGRKAFFSAFLDREAGYAAISSIARIAASKGHLALIKKLQPIVDAASRSSVAIETQCEFPGVPRQNVTIPPLGRIDQNEISVRGAGGAQKLAKVEAETMDDRIEYIRVDYFTTLRESEDGLASLESNAYQAELPADPSAAEGMNVDGARQAPGGSDYSSLMNDCVRLIDQADLQGALMRGREALSLITRGAAPRSELARCVFYLLFVGGLMKVLQLRGKTGVNAGDQRAHAIEIAQITTAFTNLPLQKHHVAKIVNLAIASNIQIGNYGTAAKGLALLEQRKLSEVTPEIEKQFKLCKERGMADAAPVTVSGICFLTLSPIRSGERMIRCTACPAVFCERSKLQPGQVCPVCSLGRASG